MNLTALRKEVERLRELALNQRSFCACRFVEVTSQPLTKAQARIRAQNRACIQRLPNREAHVGFSSIIVPANPHH